MYLTWSYRETPTHIFVRNSTVGTIPLGVSHPRVEGLCATRHTSGTSADAIRYDATLFSSALLPLWIARVPRPGERTISALASATASFGGCHNFDHRTGIAELLERILHPGVVDGRDDRRLAFVKSFKAGSR